MIFDEEKKEKKIKRRKKGAKKNIKKNIILFNRTKIKKYIKINNENFIFDLGSKLFDLGLE